MYSWLRSERGDAFLELLAVLPIIVILGSLTLSLATRLQVHQRLSTASRELGEYVYRECSGNVDADVLTECVENSREELWGLNARALKLEEDEKFHLPSLTKSLPTALSPMLDTNGMHVLTMECEIHRCLDSGGGECDRNDSECTCRCFGKPGMGGDPALDLRIGDSDNTEREFSDTDRRSLWREYRELLELNGRIVIATSSAAYPDIALRLLGGDVGHEQTVY